MELMFVSLVSDILNPISNALEIGPEQEAANSSSEEEVHSDPIVLNNIRTRKFHLKCSVDITFAVAYYDLGSLAIECEFCSAPHFDCEEICTISVAAFIIRRLCF